MGRFRHQSTFVVAAGVLALLAVASRAQDPVFDISTKLIRLIVTVKDAKGQPVGDLKQAEFSLFDSGVKQKISYFEQHTEVPLSVSLLIDTSLSTKKDFDYELISVRKFIRALLREGNKNDQVALYSFAYDVTLETSFTNREQRLMDALTRLKPASGTSLYDAIYLASRQSENRDARHVFIIVTDGGDTTSKQTFQTALRAAQFSEAIIYPILVTPITNEPGRNLGGEHALAQFADSTGGRVFEPITATKLDQNFQTILRDLRTQYLIGFQPGNLPPGLPAFHPLRVEIARPQLRASTRSGYYEDSKGNTKK